MKSPRERIRETFTPSRVGLLSWAFAAVVMGTVGVASYQFGAGNANFARNGHLMTGQVTSGLPLPAAGPVETTASIGSSSRGQPLEILQLPQRGQVKPAADINQSQIEVLQKEIVGLRRRLSALLEQNIAYSRRIAALEQRELAPSMQSADGTAAAPDDVADGKAIPSPGTVTSKLPGTLAHQETSTAGMPRRKAQAASAKTTKAVVPATAHDAHPHPYLLPSTRRNRSGS